MPKRRSKSLAAIRARARRARQRDGIDFDIRLRTITKPLVAMLRASARLDNKIILEDKRPRRADVEREFKTYTEQSIARWQYWQRFGTIPRW
jgi:hypothetical protein